jgi:hypothetical protein
MPRRFNWLAKAEEGIQFPEVAKVGACPRRDDVGRSGQAPPRHTNSSGTSRGADSPQKKARRAPRLSRGSPGCPVTGLAIRPSCPLVEDGHADQLPLDCILDEPRPVVDVKFAHQVGLVDIRGLHAQFEPSRNLLRGMAIG